LLEFLALSAFVLAAVSAVFLALLVGRRVTLARREEEFAAARARLLPFALALVEGTETAPASRLSRRDEEVLADLLGELSRRLRGDSRERIAAHFRGSSALRNELAALSSRRTWKRATAASRLGDMAAVSALPALREALDDPERDVRSAVARSLGLLGDVVSAPRLVQRLADGSVPRGLTAHALMTIGPEALPALGELLLHEDSAIRAVAVRLLGLLGGAPDAGAAEAALVDPAAEVRAAAADSLARIGSPASALRLRTALGDRIGFVAAAAATALGELRDVESAPALVELARGRDFEVARAAAEALARIDPVALRHAAEASDAGPHLHEAADLLALRG
jgi:HEAT repeat protein